MSCHALWNNSHFSKWLGFTCNIVVNAWMQAHHVCHSCYLPYYRNDSIFLCERWFSVLSVWLLSPWWAFGVMASRSRISHFCRGLWEPLGGLRTVVWVWVLVAVQSLLAQAPETGTVTEHLVSWPLKYRTTDFDFYGIVLMLASWFVPSRWLSS